MLKKLTGPGLLRLSLSGLVFVDHLTRFYIGSAAVYAFFSLSGFWIYHMYVHRYSRANLPYFTYIVSRFWRLLPTFWLVSLLTFLLLAFEGALPALWQAANKTHIVLSTLTILGYDSLRWKPIGPAWSLDVEMEFYVIAPFLIMLLASRRRVIPILLAAASLMSIWSISSGSRIPLTTYLVFFLLGMSAAALNWKPSGKLVALFSVALLVAMIVCICSPWRGILLLGAHRSPLAVYSPAANVVIGVLVFPYAMYTTRQKGFAMDSMFGDLSYIVYLAHWGWIVWARTQPGGLLRRAAIDLPGCIGVMVVSWLIWKFYDHPINRLRSEWVSRRMKPAVVKASTPETAQVV